MFIENMWPLEGLLHSRPVLFWGGIVKYLSARIGAKRRMDLARNLPPHIPHVAPPPWEASTPELWGASLRGGPAHVGETLHHIEWLRYSVRRCNLIMSSPIVSKRRNSARKLSHGGSLKWALPSLDFCAGSSHRRPVGTACQITDRACRRFHSRCQVAELNVLRCMCGMYDQQSQTALGFSL